jgi:hypothetical protein
MLLSGGRHLLYSVYSDAVCPDCDGWFKTEEFMTIRYQCDKCKSVLKIRDELAGTEGKCPKCKTGFTVPECEPEEIPGIEIDDEVGVDQADVEDEGEDDDLVDLPIDVTPDVDLSAAGGGDFDPMDVLGGGGSAAGSGGSRSAAAGGGAGGAAAAAQEKKPSVAELMRDFEKSKKKPAASGKKGGIEAASAAAREAMTSGSAADVISNTYNKKRGKAPEPKPLSREEQRAAEEKEAMKQFAMRAAGGLAVMGVLGYFFFSWVFSEALPDLTEVTGVVRMEGSPMAGVRVMFAPIKGPDGGEIVAGSSTGVTDAEGRYELMYDPENYGATPGLHQVELMTRDGVMIVVPAADREQSVTMDGENVFDFNL